MLFNNCVKYNTSSWKQTFCVVELSTTIQMVVLSPARIKYIYIIILTYVFNQNLISDINVVCWINSRSYEVTKIIEYVVSITQVTCKWVQYSNYKYILFLCSQLQLSHLQPLKLWCIPLKSIKIDYLGYVIENLYQLDQHQICDDIWCQTIQFRLRSDNFWLITIEDARARTVVS